MNKRITTIVEHDMGKKKEITRGFLSPYIDGGAITTFRCGAQTSRVKVVLSIIPIVVSSVVIASNRITHRDPSR